MGGTAAPDVPAAAVIQASIKHARSVSRRNIDSSVARESGADSPVELGCGEACGLYVAALMSPHDTKSGS
jgi:hypothetical protein